MNSFTPQIGQLPPQLPPTMSIPNRPEIDALSKECPLCKDPGVQCKHCRCPGYLECDHRPGECCTRERYKRRLVCNPCERHKLEHSITGSQSYPITQTFNTPDGNPSGLSFSSSQNIGKQMSYPSFNYEDSSRGQVSQTSAISQPITSMEAELPMGLADNSSIFESYNNVLSEAPSGFDSSRTEVSRTVIQIHPQSMPPGFIVRKDIIHLNIENNSTPFAVIPIKKDDDTLAYVRQYIEMKIKQAPKEFLFLTTSSSPIEKEQEKEILAYANIITDDWKHHTFNTMIKRDHLFIRPLDYSDIGPTKRRRGSGGGGGDDDDDDDNGDDDDRRKRKLLEELFLNAPVEVQKKLALSVFDHFHSNIKTTNTANTSNNTASTVNTINTCTTSLTHRLIEMNNIMGLNYVLINGGDINEVDTDGNTLLHKSCMLNNWQITSLLVSTLFIDKNKKNSVSLLCGNLDLFIRNKKNQLAIELTTNSDIKKLLNYCMNNTQLLTIYNNNNKNINKRIKLNDVVDDIKSDEKNDIYIDNTVFKYQGNVIEKQQNNDIIIFDNSEEENGNDNVMNIEIFIKPFSMDLNEYLTYKQNNNNTEKKKSMKKINPFKITKAESVDFVKNKSENKLPFIVNKVLAPAASAPPTPTVMNGMEDK